MATSGTFSINWVSGIWATAGNTKTYHLSGNWSKSGNTITLSGMALYATMLYASYGSDTDTFLLRANGTQILSQGRTLSASGGTATSYFYPNNASFTVSGSATSATISAGHSGESDWGSTSISFDATYVAPTTPTISATAGIVSDASVTYGTTSFGNPSTGTVYLYGGTTASPTAQLNSATTTGDHTFAHTGLDFNTTYYYRSRAYNGQQWSSYSTEVSVVTAPPATTISLVSHTTDSVTFAWSVPADGGALNKDIEYRVDNGSYVVIKTITGGGADSGTYTVTGLTPGSTHNIYIRAKTANTWKIGGHITVTLSFPLYGSVNGEAKAINKLYGSVNNETKEIIKLYGSVNGATKRIY